MKSLTLLSKSQAFNPGSQLWVLPLDAESNWISELDWHLNFMISSFFHRSQNKRPAELIEICEGCEFESKDTRKPLTDLSNPLLLSTSQFLPAKWVLLVPKEGFSTLENHFKKTWEKLGKPNTRFFLNSNINQHDLNLATSSLDSVTEFSAVIA